MAESSKQKEKDQKTPRRSPIGSIGLGGSIVLAVTAAAIFGFITLFVANQRPDPGIRVWLLNHTPDQVAIINPFDGVVEKKFNVADGLREIVFSRDYGEVFVLNVVDVTNKVSVLDTQTYLKEEVIEVDGIPQGLGVFPNDDLIAVILGSRTTFEAGGFDVLNVEKRSKSDPEKRERVWRERGLRLSHKIAVGDDDDRVYLIDAKDSQIYVYSLQRQRSGEEPLLRTIDLMGSPEEMYYPEAGDYFYVSVLAHDALYQISKRTDEITAAYIYDQRDPESPFFRSKLRHAAVTSDGAYLFASCGERKSFGYWQIGNPDNRLSPIEVIVPASEKEIVIHNVDYYLPNKKIMLKGGYDANLLYVPSPKQIAIDYRDDYVFIVDEEGALYTYDMIDIMRAESGVTLEPRTLLSEIKGEMRDMKVSRPPIGLNR